MVHQNPGLASEELPSVFPGRVHTQQGPPRYPDAKEPGLQGKKEAIGILLWGQSS